MHRFQLSYREGHTKSSFSLALIGITNIFYDLVGETVVADANDVCTVHCTRKHEMAKGKRTRKYHENRIKCDTKRFY